jgi:alkanesulfonate monooxygenase SsuD/methylene tetrahydromethanopterin reductase-like flavin-dependent oxidoreductase (luciferase family)
VEIGVGIDERLGLDYAQQRELVREAARLGYASVWSPSSVTSHDAFHTCVQWFQASGLSTGISVVPAPVWTPVALASQAATVGELTEGRFILGIGPGSIHLAAFRRTFGLPEQPPIALMRDYLTIVRGLLAGERVDYAGRTLSLRGVQLGFRPAHVPVYLAALGPQMLRLAGQLADGVAPNWASPEQIAWSRERVAEGARRAGRDPGGIPIIQYIRVCVDDDEAAARRALGAQLLAYALARPGTPTTQGYRGLFGRMGFDTLLTELEARRDAGESHERLVEALPDDLLRRVGYYGKPDGAAVALEHLAEGLDVAIVRIITLRPSLESALVALRACRPG